MVVSLWFVLLTTYSCGPLKEDVGTYAGKSIAYRFWWGILKERNYLEVLGI